jgi:hypothetical protein
LNIINWASSGLCFFSGLNSTDNDASGPGLLAAEANTLIERAAESHGAVCTAATGIRKIFQIFNLWCSW